MAFTQSTVGDGASQAVFAADAGPLQLWENFIDGGTPGDLEALIITGFLESCGFSGFGAGTWNLWVHAERIGKTKIVIKPTTPTSRIINVNDADIDSFLLEDLEFDSTGTTGANTVCFRVFDMKSGGTVDTNRCIFHNASGDGALVRVLVTWNVRSCLAYRCGGNGFLYDTNSVGADVRYRNSGAFGNGIHGFHFSNDSDMNCFYYNCWAMDNASTDFFLYSPAFTEAHECVSSDTSATSTSFDVLVGGAINKTAFGTYFQDHLNNNFRYADGTTQSSNWGITGVTGLTPVDDLDGMTRTVDAIGPYESWTRATVGSGGTHTTLSAWLTSAVNSGATGNYEAAIVGALTDNALLDSITNNVNIWIHGITQGIARKVLTVSSVISFVNSSFESVNLLVRTSLTPFILASIALSLLRRIISICSLVIAGLVLAISISIIFFSSINSKYL